MSHFDGVDERGHVSYCEQIGDLDLGEELKVPLFIIFNSSWEASSPYLGKGWNLCLLESRMEQVDENTFKLVQPDGWYRMFVRGKASDNVLGGQGDWKAEIKGETITAYADCGWKITFNGGKIASMTTPKGRRLDWVYEGGRVSEVREGSTTRLKVEYGADSRVKALGLHAGQRILVTQGDKPRVQTIGGQNVITGTDHSLTELTLGDVAKHTYDFGVEEHGLPSLKIVKDTSAKEGDNAGGSSQPRLLAWNPQTLLAARDGGWIYQITPAAHAGDNAAICRTNNLGQREYWFYNGEQGEETTMRLDGSQEKKSWFVSGLLTGEPRISRVEDAHGGLQYVCKMDYDGTGRVIRKRENDLETIFDYGVDGNLAQERIVNAKGVLKKLTIYDHRNPMYIYNDGVEIFYNTAGMVQAVKQNGSISWYMEYDPMGRLVRRLHTGINDIKITYQADGATSEEFMALKQ